MTLRTVGLDSLVFLCKNRIPVIVDASVLIAIGAGRPSLENLEETVDMNPCFIITTSVAEELHNISESYRPSDASKARLAIRLLEASGKEFYIINTGSGLKADDDIFFLALKLKRAGIYLFVATLDKGLRRRLKEIGVPTIYLRTSEMRFEKDGDVI